MENDRNSSTLNTVTPSLPNVVPMSPSSADEHGERSPFTTTRNSTCISRQQQDQHETKKVPVKSKSSNGEQGNDEPSSTATTTTTKKKRAKKPDDMPRRPLSAYNIFFQNQRHLIVNEIEEDDPSMPFSLQIPRPPRATRCRKRLHRKMHGKIGFVALAKKIGKKWKSLSKEEKEPYLSMAALEKAKYHEEMRIYAFKKKNPSWFSQQQLHNASAGGHNISKKTFVPPPHTTRHSATTSTGALRGAVVAVPPSAGPGGPRPHYSNNNPPHHRYQQPVLFQEDSRNKTENLFNAAPIGSRERPSSMTRDHPSFSHQKIYYSSTTATRTGGRATSTGGRGGPAVPSSITSINNSSLLYDTNKSNKNFGRSTTSTSNANSSSQSFYHCTSHAATLAENVRNAESSRHEHNIKHQQELVVSFRRATSTSQEEDSYNPLLGSPVRCASAKYFQSPTRRPHHHSRHDPPTRENQCADAAISSSSEYSSPSTPPRNFVESPQYYESKHQSAPDNVKLDFETIFEYEEGVATDEASLYEMICYSDEKTEEDNIQQQDDKKLNHVYDFEPYPFEEKTILPNSSSFSQDHSKAKEQDYFKSVSRNSAYYDQKNGGNDRAAADDSTHHYSYNLTNQHVGDNNSHFVSPNNDTSQENFYLGDSRETPPFPIDKKLNSKSITSSSGTISMRSGTSSTLMREHLIVSPTASSGENVVVNGTLPESELTNDEIVDFLQPLFVENTEAV